MKLRYFGEYQNFKCIADKCPATCCSGWAIEIDEESLERYDSEDELADKVDWQEECFLQQANGDCIFLKENGLCEMIISHGEKFLCKTCDQYPRHTEEFPNVREYSLSISCPVVAKDILSTKEPITITETENRETEAVYEDFDCMLYEQLLQCRKEVLEVLQDRSQSFLTRSNSILRKMKNVQEERDGFEPLGEEDFVTNQLLFERKEAFQLLFELEPLQPAFREFLEEAREILFQKNFPDLLVEFEEKHPLWEIWCEQIASYFIFTYMCGAAYDEYIYSMTAQAVFNAQMIKLLWVAKWQKNKAKLSLEELAEIVYNYSRELEHSNENMILLEQLLDDLGLE